MDTNPIEVGCRVTLKECGSGDEEEFEVVPSAAEANVLANKVSPDDPLGRALLGKVPGDRFSIKGPVEEVDYLVLDVRAAS